MEINQTRFEACFSLTTKKPSGRIEQKGQVFLTLGEYR